MSVYLELAPGDTLMLGNNTRIRFEKKAGQRARLAIDSPEDIKQVKAGQPLPDQTQVLQRPNTPAAAPQTQPGPAQPFLQRKTPIPA